MLRFFQQLDQRLRHWNRVRIEWTRQKILFTLHFVLTKFLPQATASTGQDYLILRLDAKLGDSLCSSGFLLALAAKAKQQNARVYVLTDPSLKPFFSLYPEIKVITAKRGLVGTCRALRELKALRFHCVVNTSHILSPRSLFLIARVPAARKLSFATPHYQVFTEHVVFDVLSCPIIERYERVYQQIFQQKIKLGYILPVPAASQQKVQVALRSQPVLEGPFLLLNCFAGAARRSFHRDSVEGILTQLAIRLPHIPVVCMGNPGDQQILRDWQKQIPNFVRLPEIQSLEDNIALLQKASLVISPDTAIVHMASALGKPLIAVYRPDMGEEKNALIWAPLPSEYNALVFAKPAASSLELDINSVDPKEIAEAAVSLAEKVGI